MKRIWKTLVTLTLVLALSAGMSTMVFAQDTSIDDILSMLSSLDDGELTDELEGAFGNIADELESALGGVTDKLEEALGEVPAGEADGNTNTVGGVTYTIPEGMTEFGELEEGIMYLDSTLTTNLAINYLEAGAGEDISLDNEMNQELLISGITGEGTTVDDHFLITVDGRNALEVIYSQPVGNINVQGRAIVIQMDTGIFVAALTSNKGDPEDLFDSFVASIRTDGQATAPSGTPESGKDTLTSAGSGTGSAPADAIDATLTDEVVLLDDELCTVSLKKFEIPEDDWYGFTVKVFLENKSDQPLNFSADLVTLNGYVIDPYFFASVDAGHKSNTELTFYADDMEANNISSVNELAMELSVLTDDYDELENEYFTILPFGADAPAQPPQEFPADATVLVDNDIVTMIVTGATYSDDYYTYIPVYIENHTDRTISFSTYGSSAVNGYEIRTVLYETIPAGKKANADIYWDLDDLEDNDIDVIEEVELDLTIEDDADWTELFHDMIVFEAK